MYIKVLQYNLTREVIKSYSTRQLVNADPDLSFKVNADPEANPDPDPGF